MISLFLFILAAICNAIMDVVTHHFESSIFCNENKDSWAFKNSYWLDANRSWINKYIDKNPKNGFRKLFYINYRLPFTKKYRVFSINYHVQLSDAWHFFKMWMIILLALSVITFDNQVLFLLGFNHALLCFILLLIAYGIAWNCTFSLFYNIILKRKSDCKNK